MLQSLNMKNVALIENATLSFTKGLNVLSGETGSGKSVVVDSLNFVLGGKADKSMIRNGATECVVQAVFSVDSHINDLLNELGYEPDDDGVLIVWRKFTVEGKGEIRINGQIASASILRRVTSLLVDVHGQSEHFSLLKAAAQLNMIDSYSEDVENLKKELSVPLKAISEINQSLEEIGGDESERARRLDVLSFQIAELEQAELLEGEEEDLILRRKKLLNSEKIASALGNCLSCLTADDGALDGLRMAARYLSSVAGLDEEYASVSDRLSSALAEIEDIAATVGDFSDSLESGEEELNAVENRLDLLRTIYRKYGGDYTSAIAFLKHAKDDYDMIFHSAENVLRLEGERQKMRDKAYEIALKLRNVRELGAKRFSKAIIQELADLGMAKTVVDVAFTPIPQKEETLNVVTKNGFDSIEMLFSPNLGEPLKPLAKIISGGEMSRFMLAIKAQTAKTHPIGTCVFDEIDTGISGKNARIVAEKFYKIAQHTQVIAISHLPQICAMADTSHLIYKVEEGGKTYTKTKTLTYDEHVDEVVRLVGGEGESVAVAHAKNMIESAKKYQESLSD